MTKFIPPGFNADAVRTGLLDAMGFGEPTRTEDKATFYFAKTRTQTADPAVPSDQDGVPFDPAASLTTADSKPKIQVPCAVEYVDAGGDLTTAGEIVATHLKITLLDTEYQQVKGFAYVVAGGDKYLYTSTEPPVALGSIDVWTVHCTAEDET